MKNRLLKTYDKLLLALLGFFPFFSGCDEPRVEYGMPTADYKFKGTVTDNQTNMPVENLQVTIQSHDLYEMANDTVFTDSNGKYSFEYTALAYEDLSFKLKVEDIDGTVNGGSYLAKEDSVTLGESNWDKSESDGWYVGKVTVNKDFKLNK